MNKKNIWNIISTVFFVASILFLIFFIITYIYSNIIPPPPSPETLLTQAETHRFKGQFRLSKQAYEDYIAQNKESPDGYIGYAELLLENGFINEAETQLNILNSITLNASQKSEYHLIQGRIHERRGDFLDALWDYRDAYRYNKYSLMNSLILITANIKISERTDKINEEFNVVLKQLEMLSDDPTVFIFINAWQAYDDGNYETAYELFEESIPSKIAYISNESFCKVMQLTEKVEPDALSRQKRQRDILQMAEDSDDCIELLKLYLKETYAVSLYRQASKAETPDQERAEMIREAGELFDSLINKGVETPDVYICYAEILRSEGQYIAACRVLKKAERQIGDHILILISQAYAEADLQSNFTKDYSNIKKLNERIEELFNEEAEYKEEMSAYRDFIKKLNRMELI